MENIRQAVERARAGKSPPGSRISETMSLPRRRIDVAPLDQTAGPQINETELNDAYLQSKRVVAYNGADQRTRPYDMLRTQVLQSMNVSGWKILAVTSPTPGCGKTLTAINLAFSIARQPDQSVLLVDFDLQKPQVANYLGLRPVDDGALAVLQERATLRSTNMLVRAGKQRITVLPTISTRESSELIGSRAMRSLLQDIRRHYQSHTVILDLPPILSSDDVISILPQVDCVLLVAAVGLSKASEVEECNRYLQSSHLLRLVVNKANEESASYYCYY